MAAIMTTSGATLIKAGAGVSAIISGTGAEGLTADEIITQFINEAESLINAMTRINYSDSYAALNADSKHILSEVASSLAAISCVKYDMAGYTSRIEAEDTINVLRDAALRGLSLLRDKKTTTFIDGA